MNYSSSLKTPLKITPNNLFAVCNEHISEYIMYCLCTEVVQSLTSKYANHLYG